MPCGQLEANAVFFRFGAPAYNPFVLFKRLALPESWRRHQVATLRWRLYQSAGKVVTHAGAIILKVARRAFALFEETRTPCREQSCQCRTPPASTRTPGNGELCPPRAITRLPTPSGRPATPKGRRSPQPPERTRA